MRTSTAIHMIRRATGSMGFVIAAVLLTGCGGHKSEPLFGTQPTTVGTLSQETQKAPIIRDIVAIRGLTTETGGKPT